LCAELGDAPVDIDAGRSGQHLGRGYVAKERPIQGKSGVVQDERRVMIGQASSRPAPYLLPIAAHLDDDDRLTADIALLSHGEIHADGRQDLLHRLDGSGGDSLIELTRPA
jgi:hypothetical protein